MPLKYQRFLKPYSRSLRNNSTLGEILLWNELKQKKLSGYQFYRQKPLLSYIVDFYCPALKLVVEIDGKYHNDSEQQIMDDIRQQQLETSGIHFLRFTEQEVRTKLQSVLEYIEDYVESFQNGGNPPEGSIYAQSLRPPFSKGRTGNMKALLLVKIKMLRIINYKYRCILN